MNFYITEVKVNGINLNEGDEIGIFDGETCVGAAALSESPGEGNDSIILSVKAGSNDVDTPGKDGFTDGANISFKLWSSEWEGLIEPVTPVFYNSANGEPLAEEPVFEEGGTAFVSLHAVHNFAPVANAGEYREVQEGETVYLDGTNSYDPDNAPGELSFFWTSVSGLQLINDTTSTPWFNSPWLLKDSTFNFVLYVYDGNKYSASDTVRIKVIHTNLPPIAHAGENLSIDEGKVGLLDGSASYDPEGDSLAYFWSSEKIIPDNPLKAVTAFTAPEVEKDEKIPAILQVNDGELDSEPDTAWITLRQVNKKPKWKKLPSDILFAGYPYHSFIEVIDRDSLDELTIYADGLPGWMILSDTSSGIAELSSDSVPREEHLLGTWPVTLVATDGTAVIDTLFTFNITIQTGLKKSNSDQINVYPNPAKGTLIIELAKPPAPVTKVIISNLKGQIVHTSWLAEQKNSINLWGNLPGFYLVTIFANGSEHSQLILLK